MFADGPQTAYQARDMRSLTYVAEVCAGYPKVIHRFAMGYVVHTSSYGARTQSFGEGLVIESPKLSIYDFDNLVA